MARLVFYRETDRLLEHRLQEGVTIIGRSDAADLVVPHDAISRRHCRIERRGTAWVLVDTSRHGTWLSQQGAEPAAIAGEQPLREGDVIHLESFSLRFTRSRMPPPHTASEHRPAAEPVEAVVSGRGEVALALPLLEVTAGPNAGQRLLLRRALQSLGGPGSDVELDDTTLRAHHVRIAVRRGRPLLIRGNGPAFLDGARVQESLPVYPGEEVRVGNTAFTLRPEVVTPEDEDTSRLGEMVGASRAMRRVFTALRRMAVHPHPLLIVGESGTGKELAARAVYDLSRRPGPFVAVNCGALPENLLESELFGHEKGAFTGADRRREGAFQRADGGVLFLDEVGEMSEAAQVKLLRALETGEVRRVGGAKVEYPDVRVVSATNRDLEAAVGAGEFRRDLLFRLSVLAVFIPPLRQRPSDLEVLTAALCATLSAESPAPIRVSQGAMQTLRDHKWPGNVRELRNVLTRAYVMGGPEITPEAISFSPWAFTAAPLEDDEALSALEQKERQLLREAMVRHEDNASAVARELGVARSTLHYKLRRFGLK
jgi:two-component system response regulator HydG